jgi:Rrf2 family transcriptional regulator, cysteine metabolism repressor
MNISQKCQYALRATFELAKRSSEKPVSSVEIAKKQAIPPRFLESILAQLKQAGLVQSRRGASGGYVLALPAAEITVGDIIRRIDGPLDPVRCIAGSSGKACPLLGNCAFEGLWERSKNAVSEVYDSTTLDDLVQEDRTRQSVEALNYCI